MIPSPLCYDVHMRATCSIEGCDKVVHGQGWCSMHYQRWIRLGDPRAEVSATMGRHGKGGRRKLADHCSVERCDQPGPYQRGWCRRHYDRWQKYGDPLGAYIGQKDRTCSVEGCDRPGHVKDLCVMHYGRLQAHGETGEVAPRRRAAGEGAITAYGYLMHNSGGRTVLEHRLVMEGMIGRRLTPEETVHHVNGNKLDNRPENLELWSSRHPRGQRVDQLVEFAVEILRRYSPDALV